MYNPNMCDRLATVFKGPVQFFNVIFNAVCPTNKQVKIYLLYLSRLVTIERSVKCVVYMFG